MKKGDHHYEKSRSAKKLSYAMNELSKNIQYDRALEMAQEALENTEKSFGKEELIDIATILYNRAEIFRAQNEFDKAVHLYQLCNMIQRKVYSSDHKCILSTTEALKEVLEKANQARLNKKKPITLPQYAEVKLPSGLLEDERYFVHCPICGNPSLNRSDYNPNPCPHLAFIYTAVDEGFFEYQSPHFEARITEVKSEHVNYHDFPDILHQAGYENTFLAIALTESSFDSCGPHGITEIYGFDYNTMLKELEREIGKSENDQ